MIWSLGGDGNVCAGRASKTVALTIKGDTLVEGDETVWV